MIKEAMENKKLTWMAMWQVGLKTHGNKRENHFGLDEGLSNFERRGENDIMIKRLKD
jgi:hypothetical protein